jgi:Carboxypeptidase regulatory-like domain/TonB dependent receptor
MMSLKVLGIATRTQVQRKGRLFAAFLVFFLAAALYSFGQEATIIGTVTDSSGAALPNVAVAITGVETGTVRSSTTNDTGQYVAPGLPIGRYNVSAKAAGFSAAETNDVVLNVGDRIRVDFALKVGRIQEQVTVEANAVEVQTDSGVQSTVITGAQVANLGANGRSIYSLFSLAPGASSVQGDLVIPTAVSGDSNVSINGQRPGHNLQLLDGGENLDRGGSSASVMPSMDAIAEFANMTSNYDAEYGLSSAAMITTAIKSGTKQFHAEAWWNGRNNALDARNYFNPAPNPVAVLRFNVYGFNAGGQVPLWKEHPTFFFYNMEWRSIIQGGLTNQTVPLASEYPDAGGTGTGAVIPTTLPNGKPNIITVPSNVVNLGANCPGGVPPAGVVAGLPFPNNTIPDCMIDPNASALLTAGIFPLPTSGAQFIGGNNSPTTVREEIARIDHQFTSKFSVFGHWVSEQTSQTYGTTQWSGDNVPTASDVFGNPSYSAVIHTTYVISPTLLNEAAFNYNGNRIAMTPKGIYAAPSDFTFNRFFTGPNADHRIPSIDLTGTTGTNYTMNYIPWTNAANDYQLRDDVSWTRGAHQFKFGFSWALYKKVQDYFANTQGNFQFSGSYTASAGTPKGNDFADYLLGYASQYEEDAVQSAGHWNNVSYALYAQDNWRVNHRLTLNLGLRWDIAPHTYEANQQSANFYPGLYNRANAATFENDGSGNICGPTSGPTLCPGGVSPGLITSPNPILTGLEFYGNGIGIGGIGGIPKGLVNTPNKNFGPRIGFAYDLTGQGKTVVRGGFGIMFDRIQGNDMYNGATNTPFDASPTVHNVALSNPGFNLLTGNTISAADLPVLPVGITGIDPGNAKLPTSYQFSLGVQQSLLRSTVFSASYVGTQARHLNDYRAVNLPAIADLPGLVASNGAGLNTDPTLTYPGFGGVRLSEDEANSHYNALQLEVRSNLSRKLQLQVGYTYSRATDATTSNGSGGDLNNVTNPYLSWRYDVGPSLFDRTNILFANFVYQIPLFDNSSSRLLRATAGGWSIAGIITAESGAPINLGVSGENVSSVLANTGNRPQVAGSISTPHTAAEWFNPAAFAAPACAVGPDCWGNLGFDAIRGPGRDDWNLSLFKNFVISESRGSRVEFRADAFNTWNHTQFKGDINNGGISTSEGSSNFGAVTAAFDPREFQLGMKVVF